jgi:hypothetical protein
MNDSNKFNQFAQQHGAKREVWDENLKFKYQSKSLRVYKASVYGSDFLDFPPKALTSEVQYQQWCALVAGMMPPKRGRDFLNFMNNRLLDAEEEAIPPNTEEGVEVARVVLTILKNKCRNCRDFDCEQEEWGLIPGEWVFVETAKDSSCGKEVFIRFEGLMACVLDEVAMGCTETKMTRKEIVDWLLAHGRHLGRDASPNRVRSAYAIPFSLVEGFQIFALRNRI